jgi:hypothetical protein
VARGVAGVHPKSGNPYPRYVGALAEGSEALFRRFASADGAAMPPARHREVSG